MVTVILYMLTQSLFFLPTRLWFTTSFGSFRSCCVWSLFDGFSFLGDGWTPGVEGSEPQVDGSDTLGIHVWYTYIHLVSFVWNYVGKYTIVPWFLWVMHLYSGTVPTKIFHRNRYLGIWSMNCKELTSWYWGNLSSSVATRNGWGWWVIRNQEHENMEWNPKKPIQADRYGVMESRKQTARPWKNIIRSFLGPYLFFRCELAVSFREGNII